MKTEIGVKRRDGKLYRLAIATGPGILEIVDQYDGHCDVRGDYFIDWDSPVCNDMAEILCELNGIIDESERAEE